MHDLKTPEGVLAYLKGTRFSASNVQTLLGGYSAFIYRVALDVPLESGEKTMVIKHFERLCARMEGTGADDNVERGEHEYKALSAIAASGLFDSDSIVQLPRPIDYDQETHTIFMHDLGSPIPLAQVLEKGFSDNVSLEPNLMSNQRYKLASDIGRALGDFVGRFHNWSVLPNQATIHAYFAQKPDWERKIVSARRPFLTLSADRFGARESWMDEFIAKEEHEASELINGGVLVMGDCSLHNILVSPPSGGRDMRIYLTDLEVARISCPEVDIGELTASAVSFELLYYPGVNYPFIPALHQAYSFHRTLNARRIGAMTGTDLMRFGPIFPWARGRDEAELRKVAMAGLELWKTSIEEVDYSVKASPFVRNLFSRESQLPN
ncbi:hypothetical protein OPQ81_000789 [Rhizoctonia solani]|nr:hypothetical protein OPQ81_000789 [Rhizoctonia solani]